ncbi:hypothetical protein PENSTE_c001G05769 [Penicillium steckii]|uniref:Uncharacterized protein n=1 Tax=Penicillium steckii TaxID=303698 RepID=A0A1V6U197_9EURO|nr:hypothetical protein PENSTE_c001G05769 [Penicillium steckii]
MGIDCSIQRKLRKRGRRGRMEQVNAKRTHDTITEQDIPEPQEEPGNSASQDCAMDEVWSTSSFDDTTIASDQVGQLYSPGTSSNIVDDCLALDTNGSYTRMNEGSDILEELGMGITEDWNSHTRLFDDIIDLDAENDLEFPPLLEMWPTDEMESDTTDPICSSIQSIQEDVTSSVLSRSTSPCLDSMSNLDCGDTMFRSLLNTYLLSEHLLMSWFPMMMT